MKCSIGGGISSPSTRIWYLSRSFWSWSAVRSRMYLGGLQLTSITSIRDRDKTEGLPQTLFRGVPCTVFLAQVPYPRQVSYDSLWLPRFLHQPLVLFLLQSSSSLMVHILIKYLHAKGTELLTFCCFLQMNLLCFQQKRTFFPSLFSSSFLLSLGVLLLIQVFL